MIAFSPFRCWLVFFFGWAVAALGEDALLQGQASLDADVSITSSAGKVPEFRIDASHRKERPNGSVTLLRGEPSLLPDPEPPLTPEPLSEEEEARLAAFQAEVAARPVQKFFSLSATVVDGGKTFLRWYAPGRIEPYEAWSNVDFNNFSGFGSFESEGVEWIFIMSVGNVPHEYRDRMTWLPSAPVAIPGVEPAFVVTKGDAGNREARAPIVGLHDLFTREKHALIAARWQREIDRSRREEEARARAAKPRDTVMWFRPRKGSRYLENPTLDAR